MDLSQFNGTIYDVSQLKRTFSLREKPYQFESVKHSKIDDYINLGWSIKKKYKTSIAIKKIKSTEIEFKDDVWTTIGQLGFNYINKDNTFNTIFNEITDLRTQFDVLAVDDECALLIATTIAETEKTKSDFSLLIDNIGATKPSIVNTLRKRIPGKKKIKIILCTKNYVLTDVDKASLKKYDILHFNEDTVQYYKDLKKHLGLAAKYQLLGNLFPGAEIPELDNETPAIQGRMGGHTYYSFSIEPEKLLKIGYVLHRNNANIELMPTYQRLIKKSRLKSVKHFIDKGGFFPNSIIININTNGKKLRFDRSSNQVDDSISRLGILHLPKSYQSAFIIDGQHRLYGYSNSEYRNTNTIPVVAFIDLDRREQVKIFMEINENQKAVPKSLRNDLDVELLWDSDIPSERIRALELSLANKLGEDINSPLFDRVLQGENIKNSTRCITTESIRIGLNKSKFFPTYNKKGKVTFSGNFFINNNDTTKEKLYPFLLKCLTLFSEELNEEWQIGEGGNGYLSINAGIESLIKIFGDIVNHLTLVEKIDIKSLSLEEIFTLTAQYLNPIVEYFKGLTEDEKKTLKTSYGAAGKGKYWRNLQSVINKNKPDFNPEGLAKYLRDAARAFNDETFTLIADIELFLKEDFRKKLISNYGNDWYKIGIPRTTYLDASALASQKNLDNDQDNEVTFWECMNIIAYRKIAVHQKNWSEIFEKYYTKPGEEKLRGGKEEKTKWMQTLESIRNKCVHNYSVNEDEYNFINELHAWLIDN